MSYQVIDILTDVGNTYILSEPIIREMYCYDFFIKIDRLVQEGQYFLEIADSQCCLLIMFLIKFDET